MKRVIMYMMMIPLMAGMISSCTGEKTDARQLSGRWTIAEVDGDKVTITGERTPFMEFNMSDMRVHGNAGCNTFNAPIKLDSTNVSKISLTPAVTTMMACPDMDTENKILKAIDSVAEVKVDTNNSNEMLLTNNVGKVLFRLTK